MQVARLDLKEIHNNSVDALREYKEWLCNSYCIYFPCRFDEIDCLFKLAFSQAGDNILFILTPQRLLADQIIKDKTFCIHKTYDSVVSFWQTLCEPDKATDKKDDDGIYDKTGILLFIKRTTEGISILPPQLFKDVLPPECCIYSYYLYDNKAIYVFRHSLPKNGNLLRLYMSNSDYGARWDM